MKTYMAKPGEIERRWYIVDAKGKTLGRLSTEVAKILTGKNKPIYTPHVDTGDHVIVINADKVVLTGKKLEQKVMYRYSGYPGGLKVRKYSDLMITSPELVVKKSILGMLPKNKLGRAMGRKLKVYRGESHPHEAQQPKIIEIEA